MYKYEDYKHIVFEEENQKRFLEVRDNVKRLLTQGKYFDMTQATSVLHGNNWENMAFVDRLLELGEIREVVNDGSLRLFTKA